MGKYSADLEFVDDLRTGAYLYPPCRQSQQQWHLCVHKNEHQVLAKITWYISKFN